MAGWRTAVGQQSMRTSHEWTYLPRGFPPPPAVFESPLTCTSCAMETVGLSAPPLRHFARQAAISQFNGYGDRQTSLKRSYHSKQQHDIRARPRSWTGPYRPVQRPLCQTQRRPFQRQRPGVQRGCLQPRGGGGRLSTLGGGIGAPRGCATAVLNGATKGASHAISSALRLRIHPTSGQLE